MMNTLASKAWAWAFIIVSLLLVFFELVRLHRGDQQ